MWYILIFATLTLKDTILVRYRYKMNAEKTIKKLRVGAF